MNLGSSKIKANGDPGQRFTTAPGSGGGAGGSISIVTKHLVGDSLIEAHGGDGSEGGGGGGAGGRMSMHFLKGYSSAHKPNQGDKYWTGKHSIKGGIHGFFSDLDDDAIYQNGVKGQDGEIKAGKCFGGYSGPFC